MKTISTNARNLISAQLMGVDFNSAVHFNGKTYFASMDSGITREDGARDGELDINAWIVLPTTAMDLMQPKGIRTALLEGRFGGQMVLTVENESESRDYPTPDPAGTTVLRIKVDKALRGNMHRVKVANRDGASFNLSKVKAVLIPGTEYRS